MTPTGLGGAADTRLTGRFAIKVEDGAVVVGFLLLALLVCSNHLLHPTELTSGLTPDHVFYEWQFAHGVRWLRHLDNPLFSFSQNMPSGANLMANPAMVGIAVVLSPITLLLGPQLMYAIYLTFALAATATTTYWVLSRHLVSSRLAAFVGGAFIGFAPGVIYHANGQPVWVSNFLLPFILLYALKLGDPGRRWRRGAILGLLVACQLFINAEMLLVAAAACAVVVLVYTVERWSDARARAVPFLQSLGVCGGVVAVLAGYPLWFQFFGPQSFRGLQGGVFQNWGEDLTAFVAFARDSIAGSSPTVQTIGVTEQNTLFGWPLVIVVVLAAFVLGRSSVAARASATVMLIFAFASLGPYLRFDGRLTIVPGPWRLISQNLPVVEWMIPSRLNLATIGAVGVLLALTLNQVAAASPYEQRPAGWLRFAVYAAVAAALLPIIPKPLATHAVDDPPRFITSGEWRRYVSEGQSIVPIPIPSNLHGLETLRWSALTEHDFAVPGGYFIGPDAQGKGTFGVPPRPTTSLVVQTIDTGQPPVVTVANKLQAIEDLRYWRASLVVLGPHPLEPQLRTLMTGLLGSPQRVDDVWLWDVRRISSSRPTT